MKIKLLKHKKDLIQGFINWMIKVIILVSNIGNRTTVFLKCSRNHLLIYTITDRFLNPYLFNLRNLHILQSIKY